jgi:hypothetical protein
MILTSNTMGGVEFGSVGSAIAKGAVLITFADAASLIPGLVGLALSLIVWWGGLMLLFRIDFWECRTLVAINWLLNVMVHLALVAMLGPGPEVR